MLIYHLQKYFLTIKNYFRNNKYRLENYWDKDKSITLWIDETNIFIIDINKSIYTKFNKLNKPIHYWTYFI